MDKRTEAHLLRMHDLGDLTWLPWVGDLYAQERVLVVGESNYADKEGDEGFADATARVNADIGFTCDVVRRICFADQRKANPTFDGITNMIDASPDAGAVTVSRASRVWSRIAYMDIVQTAVSGRGWGNASRAQARDLDSDEWRKGWRALFDIIGLLRPRVVMFVGFAFTYHWGRGMLPTGCRINMVSKPKHLKIGGVYPRSGNLTCSDGRTIDAIAVPNPGGAHGFSAGQWRKLFVSKYVSI